MRATKKILLIFILLIISSNSNAFSRKFFPQSYIGGLTSKAAETLSCDVVIRTQAVKHIQNITFSDLILLTAASLSEKHGIPFSAALEPDDIIFYDKLLRIGFSDDITYQPTMGEFSIESASERIIMDTNELIKIGAIAESATGALLNYSIALNSSTGLVHWAITRDAKNDLSLKLNRVHLLSAMIKNLKRIFSHYSEHTFSDITENVPDPIAEIEINQVLRNVLSGLNSKRIETEHTYGLAVRSVEKNVLNAMDRLEILISEEWTALKPQDQHAMENLFESMLSDYVEFCNMLGITFQSEVTAPYLQTLLPKIFMWAPTKYPHLQRSQLQLQDVYFRLF